MNELDPNDKKLIATEYFDRALGTDELAWFDENGLASDPVVKEALYEAERLRAFVRKAPSPEPPSPLNFYWERVRSEMRRPMGLQGRRWLKPRFGIMSPLGGLAAALGLAMVFWVLPQHRPATLRVDRAESKQPGIYTSVVLADRASVVWITGLEYLPEGYVLR